jgi:hypothetical protein
MDKNTQEYKIDQLKAYLIDCLGYSVDELLNLKYAALLELVQDKDELDAYLN